MQGRLRCKRKAERAWTADVRALLATALLLTVLHACRRSKNGDEGAATVALRRSPTLGECDAAGGALAVTPLVFETSSGEDHPRIALGADGRFTCQGKVVGRLSGACVLDARGKVLRSVDANGIVYGAQRELAGVFQRRPKWVDGDGKTLRVDEVLVSATGNTIGITPDGAIYSAEPGAPAVSMPAGILGDVVRAPRTGLLLFDAAGELDRP